MIVWKITMYCGKSIPLIKALLIRGISIYLLLSFALKARAYIRICFTIDSKPLLRVGERCSFNPILSIK